MQGAMLRHLQALALACVSLWSWQYDAGFRLEESNCPDAGAVCGAFAGQMEKARALAEAGLLPAVMVGDKMAWAIAGWKAEDGTPRYLVLGPARLDGPARDDDPPGLSDALPQLSIQELGRYAAMLHMAIHGGPAAVHMPGQSPGLNPSERAVLLLARLQDKIRNGDLHFKELFLEVLNDQNSLNSLGVVTIESAKGTALLSIDLCCRAALETGLTEKTVNALYGEYAPQIQAAKYGHDIANISNLFMYHLVRLVRRVKGSAALSVPVQAACTYIEEHACDKLTLRALAAQVGYSPDHLAKRFKEEAGESLKDYIQRAKVNRAQLMLTTTGLSIGDIAAMLSFCSTSHFTMVFRQVTGQTPAAYRGKHSHLN